MTIQLLFPDNLCVCLTDSEWGHFQIGHTVEFGALVRKFKITDIHHKFDVDANSKVRLETIYVTLT